jgi:hypothetical protein
MDVASYFSEVLEGFEFLIALGSLIGIFGVVIGGFMLFLGGRPFKSKGLKIMLVSIILLGLFGFNTGLKYFRL